MIDGGLSIRELNLKWPVRQGTIRSLRGMVGANGLPNYDSRPKLDNDSGNGFENVGQGQPGVNARLDL